MAAIYAEWTAPHPAVVGQANLATYTMPAIGPVFVWARSTPAGGWVTCERSARTGRPATAVVRL